MAKKKRIQKSESIGIKLTQAERKLLLDTKLQLPKEVERVAAATPPSTPVMFTIDELYEFVDHVAAAANQARDEKLSLRLFRLFQKLIVILETYTDKPGSESSDNLTAGFIESFLNSLVGEGPKVLPLPTKSKKGEDRYPLRLTEKQRESLVHATRLRRGIKNQLDRVDEGPQTVGFTRRELEEMVSEVDQALAFAPSADRKRLDAVFSKLEDLQDALEENPPIESGRKPEKPSDRIYQLKIALKDIKPPVWRRIQVPDGSLGQLHEILQIVMGWTDSHLHEFIVRGEHYGSLGPVDFGFGPDMEVEDEDGVLLSQFIKGDRKVRFRYVYDFGDGWQHDIEFERLVAREPKVGYPRCVAGARACPPEDVGGPWGYPGFLEAIGDPKHECHEELMEWIGGKFDPEKFAVDRVNRELRQCR